MLNLKWKRKTSVSSCYKENNFKLCLNILNMFKLWCERGITDRARISWLSEKSITCCKKQFAIKTKISTLLKMRLIIWLNFSIPIVAWWFGNDLLIAWSYFEISHNSYSSTLRVRWKNLQHWGRVETKSIFCVQMRCAICCFMLHKAAMLWSPV